MSCDTTYLPDQDNTDTKASAQAVFGAMDTNHDGQVTSREWCKWITLMYKTMAERTALFTIVDGHMAMARAKVERELSARPRSAQKPPG